MLRHSISLLVHSRLSLPHIVETRKEPRNHQGGGWRPTLECNRQPVPAPSSPAGGWNAALKQPARFSFADPCFVEAALDLAYGLETSCLVYQVRVGQEPTCKENSIAQCF
jgi:hypothetical protein